MLEALGLLEYLPTITVTGTLFLLSTGSEAEIEPLVRLIFSKFYKNLK
jgi:hypothetical protein